MPFAIGTHSAEVIYPKTADSDNESVDEEYQTGHLQSDATLSNPSLDFDDEELSRETDEQSADHENLQFEDSEGDLPRDHPKLESASSVGSKSNASENDQLPPLSINPSNRLSLPSLVHISPESPQFSHPTRYSSTSHSLRASSLHSTDSMFHLLKSYAGNIHDEPSSSGSSQFQRYRRQGVSKPPVIQKPLASEGPYYPQGNIFKRFSSPSVVPVISSNDSARGSRRSDGSISTSRRASVGGRRFSDLKALTTTLGSHIHGSLLSIAGTYDKAFKVRSIAINPFQCSITGKCLNGVVR